MNTWQVKELAGSLSGSCCQRVPCLESLQSTKKGMYDCPSVLAFANYTKPFLLETDASKDGLGTVLSQKQMDGQYHPVAFG